MFPKATINAYNRRKGQNRAIERTVLFVGDINTFQSVSAETDFAQLNTPRNNLLKQALITFNQNCSADWLGYAQQGGANVNTAINAVKTAAERASFEFVLFSSEYSATRAFLTQLQSLYTELLNTYQRRVFFIVPYPIDNSKSWSEWETAATALTQGIAADHVMVVPQFFGQDAAALAGRLANSAVTVADSPARVRTGALQGLGADKPLDKNRAPLALSTVQHFERQRFTSVMWYPDYEGLYFTDGNTLDVEGGDFQVIENVRIVDKACRRIRLLALAKIADRSFNNSSASIEVHKTYFTSVIREMAKSAQIGSEIFPGECYEPNDESIEIQWLNKNQVNIYIQIQPLESPKIINAAVMLDLETLGE